MKEQFSFNYEVYPSSDELQEADKDLLKAARETTKKAYAPYSNFLVGAVARMKNGKLVEGTNQENASYPVGICAERVLISAASSIFPGEAMQQHVSDRQQRDEQAAVVLATQSLE